jgi:hypothetical protein
MTTRKKAAVREIDGITTGNGKPKMPLGNLLPRKGKEVVVSYCSVQSISYGLFNDAVNIPASIMIHNIMINK